MAFSIKMSRTCSGWLSSKNDYFKLFKTAKKHKLHVHHVYHSSRARGTVFFSPNQFVVDQKHERNSSPRAVFYIFQNIDISMMVTFH